MTHAAILECEATGLNGVSKSYYSEAVADYWSDPFDYHEAEYSDILGELTGEYDEDASLWRTISEADRTVIFAGDARVWNLLSEATQDTLTKAFDTYWLSHNTEAVEEKYLANEQFYDNLR